MAHAQLLFEEVEIQIKERVPARVETLRYFISYMAKAEKSDLDRKEFSHIFANALSVLELNHETVARLLKISRPTVSRWESGISAPHPIGRKPVFHLFKQMAQAKLRQLV